jgi:hypothetical protein
MIWLDLLLSQLILLRLLNNLIIRSMKETKKIP